jgi:hypothetical protein
VNLRHHRDVSSPKGPGELAQMRWGP